MLLLCEQLGNGDKVDLFPTIMVGANVHNKVHGLTALHLQWCHDLSEGAEVSTTFRADYQPVLPGPSTPLGTPELPGGAQATPGAMVTGRYD